MDHRAEVREFLSSRRAKITPDELGLTTYGERRVPGLRRGEVASLAGISVEYYTRIERGELGGVSDSVLAALARALHLDAAERAHLLDLARAAAPLPAEQPHPPRKELRASVRWLLAGIALPAYIRDVRRDILAANPLGEALHFPLFEDPARPVNPARFVFLNPAARDFFDDWDEVAGETVASLRTEAGRSPADSGLASLIEELISESEEFGALWAAHDVRLHTTATKLIHHPVAGDLEISFEVLDLAADPGLALVACSAEPGSRSRQGLKRLANLTLDMACD